MTSNASLKIYYGEKPTTLNGYMESKDFRELIRRNAAKI